MDALDALLARNPPETLYHYTRQRGVLGITASRRLWATAIHYQNDHREYMLAWDLLIEVGRRAFKNDPVADRLLRYLLDIKNTTPTQISGGAFVACLTERGDLLSQWRGYCSYGDAFSLGFSAGVLRLAADKQQWLLAPVAYDAATQQEVALRVFREAREYGTMLADPRRGSGPDPEWKVKAIGHLMHGLQRFGPLLKHESFEEEREWRLVGPNVAQGSGQLHYRDGRLSLIPYCEFDVSAPSGRLELHEVIVGPSPHMHLSVLATEGCLVESGTRFKTVRPSSVTFRAF